MVHISKQYNGVVLRDKHYKQIVRFIFQYNNNFSYENTCLVPINVRVYSSHLTLCIVKILLDVITDSVCYGTEVTIIFILRILSFGMCIFFYCLLIFTYFHRI